MLRGELPPQAPTEWNTSWDSTHIPDS